MDIQEWIMIYEFRCPNQHIVEIEAMMADAPGFYTPCLQCESQAFRVVSFCCQTSDNSACNEMKKELKGQLSDDEYSNFNTLQDVEKKYRIISKKEQQDAIMNFGKKAKERRIQRQARAEDRLRAWRKGKGISDSDRRGDMKFIGKSKDKEGKDLKCKTK